MKTQPIQELRKIRSQINDLSISEEKAREFQQLIQQSLTLLNEVENKEHNFFENRKNIAIAGLGGELSTRLQEYWEREEKVEKIARFSQARQQANLLLGSVLATF
jgi:hypothetical protein